MTTAAYAYLKRHRTAPQQRRQIARQVGEALTRLERRNKNAARGNSRQGQNR